MSRRTFRIRRDNLFTRENSSFSKGTGKPDRVCTPNEHQRYDPRVVTERQRGTAKNSVSVSLSLKNFEHERYLHGK